MRKPVPLAHLAAVLALAGHAAADGAASPASRRLEARAPPSAPAGDAGDARTRIGRANAAARVEPDRSSYFNAIQRYAYDDGSLYQIYTAPGQVTDIALEAGEQLVGPGPVASGDTARWIIGDTVSGAGATRRVHILVKPTRADIATNLVINTDRRTYHLELRATTSTYMAAVSWTYPPDALIALRDVDAGEAPATPAPSAIEVAALDFGYRISGDRPAWRPLRVFDDGRQMFVEFAPSVALAELPPLFALGADDGAELVNYRVLGRFMIVDRLLERAELRLGNGRRQHKVRIERDPNRGRQAS